MYVWYMNFTRQVFTRYSSHLFYRSAFMYIHVCMTFNTKNTSLKIEKI